MQTDPTLNGISVNIFRIDKALSPHPFRNRVLIRGDAYVEIAHELEAQVFFFSKEALRWRNGAGMLRSLGYMWVLYGSLDFLGITPTEEEWVRYRLQFPGLGPNYYSVLGCTPRSHLDGEWLYLRVDFEEDTSSDSLPLTEHTVEPMGDFEQLIEVESV